MRALVTGAAGFIGSALCDRLLLDGHTVRGLDRFSSYYDPQVKRANVEAALGSDRFTLDESDINTAALPELLDGVDVVFHLSAQPGVRGSWADGFARYVSDNVLATQRLLEAALTAGTSSFVYASSSSVYGNTEVYPTREDAPTRAHSPYGVTKLAGEQLAAVYARNFGLRTTSLRFFTVYGPRQRPDMAMHRLIRSALLGEEFQRFGDGSQVREFTFVSDIVEGLVRSAEALPPPGTVLNLAGTQEISLNDLIALIGELAGSPVRLVDRPAAAGDVERTGGCSKAAEQLLDWRAQVDLREGLSRQIDWMRTLLGVAGPA